ncbi:MAG: hypothetical protein JW720_00040 [Sedimentisphaerales bacterium]|nr:hypothetical protein [Sedimentisphaerales bacterium]
MNYRVLLSVVLSFFISPVNGEDALPDVNDVSVLAEACRQTVDRFRRDSLHLRFQYEYSGEFLSDSDRQKLRKLAEDASESLQSISDSQTELKARIKAYDDSDDWDERYGRTGLWRKLFADIYATDVSRCEVDFYVALCVEGSNRDKALSDILSRIDLLAADYDTAYLHFLRARAMGLLARTDPSYKPAARKEFDSLGIRSDMRHSTVFKIAIERIKLLGPGRDDRLDRLTDELARSADIDDPELFLSLAILQRRLNRDEAFEKTVQTWPEVEKMLGSLALTDISYRFSRDELNLQAVGLLEAELAVQAAWANGPENYASLLTCLSKDEGFQTPLILYVTALASAENSPRQAAELLLRAAWLQKEKRSAGLDVDFETIAEQAGSLACHTHTRGQEDSRAVLSVLEACRKIAGGWANDELEYCYAAILVESGEKDKGAALLGKIAETAQSPLRHRAKLDLIALEITEVHYADRQNRAETAGRLLELLRQCREQNDPADVGAEAMEMYCRLLLESPDKEHAREVLNLLTDSQVQDDPKLNLFKSKALRYLGKVDESAECLAGICEADNPEYAAEAAGVLRAVIEQFEQVESESSDPVKFRADCLALARCCERTAASSFGVIPLKLARLDLAEILLLTAPKDLQKAPQAEAILDELGKTQAGQSVGFLRCRSRLLGLQGNFEEAARLWARVAKTEKGLSSPPGRRNPQWWRAKYYELYCVSKMPQPPRQEIMHSIEVLQNSFTDIPSFWAEKLRGLASKKERR